MCGYPQHPHAAVLRRYFMMLPANKLELWFALEAERFQVPVLRCAVRKLACAKCSPCYAALAAGCLAVLGLHKALQQQGL
jgi:hypothetical protein